MKGKLTPEAIKSIRIDAKSGMITGFRAKRLIDHIEAQNAEIEELKRLLEAQNESSYARSF